MEGVPLSRSSATYTEPRSEVSRMQNRRRSSRRLQLTWAASFLLFAAATAQAAPPVAALPAPTPAGNAVTEAALAATPSLAVLTRYAEQHNPAIRAALEAWKAARQRIAQERSYADPMVTYSPDTGSMAETRAGPQGAGVGISQEIPFPGKLTLKGDVASEQAQAAHERLQAVIQEVARGVRARYADYYLAARSLVINAATTELTQQFEDIASAKYRVGTAAQQDVILAQEYLSRLAAERVVFEGDRETALGALNALLDRPPRAALGTPAELRAQNLDVALQDLVDRARATRPELHVQDHLVQASRDSLRLAKMGYFPDFKVGGQYTEVEGGTNPSFPKDGHDIWMATIGVTVPLWVDRIQAHIEETNARVMQEKSRRQDLQDLVNDQVQRAYEHVRTASRTEEIYRTTLIPQTQQRIAAARAGYQTGIVDFLTLIDSLRSLEDVQLKRDRAVRDYQQAIADLERAVGQPIATAAP
jgi:outer membrane protein, heavy metal efflux system